MNRPTQGPLDDDEQWMRVLVSEAGDPAVGGGAAFVASHPETI